MKIAIFGSCYQEGLLQKLELFFSTLAKGGLVPGFEVSFRDYLIRSGCRLPDCAFSFEEIPEGTSAVVSIGGDGTFLRSARRVADRGIPILGVNTGHLGFLTHFTLDDADLLCSLLISGNAPVERRMLLQVEGADMPANLWPYALNEIAILKDDTSSMITTRVAVDGDFLADYLADGLVVATPTGSTAYNLAAGGPLLQPQLRVMAVTPIAPHTLTLRPLVVDGDSILEASTTSRASGYRVSIDGESFRMPCETTIRISRAPFEIKIIQKPADNFATTLRSKLLWGQR